TALANQQPERLTIVGVPNARVWAGVHAWETICDVASPATAGELRKKLESFTIAGIDPEVFWQLGESLGYDVEITWTGSGEQGTFDATFRRANPLYAQLDLNCTCATGNCRCQTMLVSAEQITEQATPSRPSQLSRSQPWHRYTTDPLKGLLAERLIPTLRKRIEESLPKNWMPST